MQDSFEYNLVQQVTRLLLSSGFGVLHGGYAGGTMEAVSAAAHDVITQRNFSPYRNIGTPQEQHEHLWKKVEHATFTSPARDIFERLALVSSGDIIVVGPVGGDGTELEEALVFHDNIIREQTKSALPRPMIFLETCNGTPWKKIFQTKLDLLCVAKKDLTAYPWLYFASSVEEFKVIMNICNNAHAS